MLASDDSAGANHCGIGVMPPAQPDTWDAVSVNQVARRC